MSDSILFEVNLACCPRCKHPNVNVPEGYDDDTIIECPNPDCKFSARWYDFFGEGADKTQEQ